jgi:hypothetical protein
MVRSANPDGANGQQSLGDLVALAAKDMSSLVRYEISLAKREFKMDASRIAVASALGVVGLFAGCLLLVLLCFAYAYGLVAVGAPGGTWGAFLWVSLTVAVLILVIGLIAYGRIRKVSGMKMTRQTVTADLGMLRKSESSPNGSGPAVSNPEVGARTGTPAEIPPARK